MPIYEYQCRQCQHVFEVLVRSAKDEKNLACPQCKGRSIDRQLSVFSARGAESSAPSTSLGMPDCGQCSGQNGICPYKP
ncbi:MAG: FmdB family zinc ribbon protein [Planctomycetota bacterium]|jgi:putative FmdB family regulatory protein